MLMLKQNIAHHFIHPQRLKQLLMRVIFKVYLNESIARLYQKQKSCLEWVTIRLLIQL